MELNLVAANGPVAANFQARGMAVFCERRYATIKFTIFFGTMMTFLTVLPARNG